MRDKFRMQHSEGAVTTADGHASGIGSDLTRKQDHSMLSSATTECIGSEEIRPLDKSPQHGAVVRGRHNSGGKNAAKTTSPSRVIAAVDSGKGDAEVITGSPRKIVSGHASTRSPVQVANDGTTAAANHSSVLSPREGGGSERACLTQSSKSRASGHVSDAGSRQDMTNDRHSHRSMSASVARQGGYVSDTSFSATAHTSAATEPQKSTASEGM